MITAMGVAAIEGPHRKAAELTLKVMRHNSETLLSVLRPITCLTSPSMIGKKKTSKSFHQQKSMCPIFALFAVDLIYAFLPFQLLLSLKRVQMRLAGTLNYTSREELSAKKSLSPEGHAKAIIRHVTVVSNLSQMYPGWGAFL